MILLDTHAWIWWASQSRQTRNCIRMVLAVGGEFQLPRHGDPDGAALG